MVDPPGRLLSIGNRRLHALVAGSGVPVVFEAGLAATSLSWSLVQPFVSRFAMTIAYDRAGLGWSDPSPRPATALNAAEDLDRLLDALGIAKPIVLVGHSFGGLIARVFEQHYSGRVAGLVLVDPVARAEWRDAQDSGNEERRRSLAHGARLSRRGAVLARFGVVGFALRMLLRGEKRFPQMIARASAGRGLGVAERLVGEVRKIPREVWPAIAEHWSRPGSFRVMASGLENLPISARQIDEFRSLNTLPLVVLSAATASPAALAEHIADAALSGRGQHQLVAGTGHWIPFDAPGLIVDIIADVVESDKS